MMIIRKTGTTKNNKLCFIGGICLRFVHNINRFSEYLDFDCKDLTKEVFIEITDSLIKYLKECGDSVSVKEYDSDNIAAFRRSIYFPELLYSLDLTLNPKQRFLLKIETADQQIKYKSDDVLINRCGFLLRKKLHQLIFVQNFCC